MESSSEPQIIEISEFVDALRIRNNSNSDEYTLISNRNLLSLPVEIILYVLQFLDWKNYRVLFYTCKAMRSLILDSSLWKYIALDTTPVTNNTISSVQWIFKLLGRTPSIQSSVKRLEMGVFHNYIAIPIFNVLSSLQNLEELSIQHCIRLKDNEIEAISTMRSLRKLLIPSAKNLSDDHLELFANNLENLAEIDFGCIQSYNKITTKGIESFILKRGRNLETIKLSGIQKLTNDLLITIARKCCNHLNRFELIGCFELNEQGYFEVFRLCRKLEHLDLSFNWQVGDQLFSRFVEPPPICDSLKSLNIQGCSQLTDIGISILSTWPMSSLHTLNISYCVNLTNSSIKALESLRKLSLKEILFEDCPFINPYGLAHEEDLIIDVE